MVENTSLKVSGCIDRNRKFTRLITRFTSQKLPFVVLTIYNYLLNGC